ncbi:unnamed protein product [Camellia sinensis]
MHCAKYLNQTLVTFGFPASLDLFASDPVSIARTCNCVYALLQQRQRDIEFRESANEQRQRLLSDISRLEARVERLEAQLSAKDREIATITRTEAKATAAFKAHIEKLQQERDEFQRLVIGNQQVRTQQIHEMKKTEKEYITLQERLNQVLMEKKKESRSGMEIMHLLQKEGRQRGTWNGKKADNDFYKKIVDAYEEKNKSRTSGRECGFGTCTPPTPSLSAQLSAKDREIATITRTEAKATAAFKAHIEKLQQERDEFQRLVIGNQQVRTQQIHEMKKTEKEYITLQERLNQVLMEKKKESRSGMEIMHLLQKEGRQRGTWNGKKN